MNIVAVEPTVVAYPYFEDNPWQRIVYSEFTAGGGDVVHLDRLEHLGAIARSRSGHCVLHMNWTGPVTQTGTDAMAAALAGRAALQHIDEFLATGGRLVWSIHNVLPHEVRFLLPELALCRALAERATAIVVMNPGTPSAVAPFYPLDPEKVVQIDHPSYAGLFPSTVDRAAARAHWGFADDDIVTVFVGVLRPYKGIDQLVRAFDIIAARDPHQRLLIGGRPGPGYTDEDLARILRPRPYLTAVTEHVPDDELQYWTGAADVVALPYTTGLNVSVVLLAATFGRPVALRRLPELAYLNEERWIAWIDGDDEQLATSVCAAHELLMSRGDADESARSYAAERAPSRIAREYDDLFRSVFSR